MSKPQDKPEEEQPTATDFYAILNVNRGASQTEINERHRALSLLFHPDKHRDPVAVEAATEEFLKVQKAYQVLSDPFLREVYDVLGERGLAVKWTPKFTSKSREELREQLKRLRTDNTLDELGTEDHDAPLKNSMSMTIDGTRLLARVRGPSSAPEEGISLLDRVTSLGIVAEDISHTFSKRIDQKTAVSLRAQGIVQGRKLGLAQYIGTVRHHFSPRITGKAVVIYGQAFMTHLTGTYHDDFNTASVNCVVVPFTRPILPRIDFTYSRRLFPRSPQTAEISLRLHEQPSLAMTYVSPSSMTHDVAQAVESGIPSTPGTKYIFFDRSFGLDFTNILPKLTCDFGATILELALRLHGGFEWGFTGIGATVGTYWLPKDGREAHVFTTMDPRGIYFQIEFTLWKQRFSLPIILASQFDPFVAACSVVIPSTAAVLGYHFIIRPRRHAHRIAQIRAARRVLEEDSDARRKRNTVVDLLKDSARKVMSSETNKGGLVIQSAVYGVIDTEDGAHDLSIDVTVPLQALVRNSQLYIPGDGSKSNLQGFSDPASFTAKSLRIHYLFRGHSHFAEIPDYLPVVLPLSEHEIEVY